MGTSSSLTERTEKKGARIGGGHNASSPHFALRPPDSLPRRRTVRKGLASLTAREAGSVCSLTARLLPCPCLGVELGGRNQAVRLGSYHRLRARVVVLFLIVLTASAAAETKHSANPILTAGPAAWDAHNVLHCSIIS